MWRVVSVLVYGPATYEGRGRYRRPKLAAAAYLLLAGETLWSAMHLWRRDRSPAVVAWADTATTAAIAVAFPNAVGTPNANPWHAWGASNTPVQAEVAPLLLERLPERAAAVALLCAAPAVGCLLSPGPTDWKEAGRAATATLFRGLWGSLFADLMRASVTRLDEAHADAVTASRGAALQRARARHRRYLQDRALGVLDTVSRSEHPRDPDLRRAANREAARLRSMLTPTDLPHLELAGLVDLAAERGVDVEVVPGQIPAAVPPHAVEALRAEMIAALGDSPAGHHSVRHVVLFVDTVDGGLVATLHGEGDARHEIRVEL